MYDVELVNVTKRFGSFTAVDNISFGIKKGEFFSLLGPSGCGKTTTLRMISGFEVPTEGAVYIAGEPMNDVPPFRRPTNLVFQHLALFPHMNVFDNIAFGLRMKKMPEEDIRKDVSEMLDIVELGDFGKRRISQLSGGQKQRVAIARALVNHPTVLLLDEPLGALDLKLRILMQIELKKIQDKVGTTFVYVTHDQGEAITMSDRIAVMNKGIIEQIGTSDEIYEKPRTKFVADFIGETNLLEGTVCDEAVVVDGLPFHVSSECKEGQKFYLSIRPEKLMVGKNIVADNVFEGKVEDVIYKGSMTIYRVRLHDRVALTVQVQNVEAGVFAKGEKVSVGCRKDCIVILGD